MSAVLKVVSAVKTFLEQTKRSERLLTSLKIFSRSRTSMCNIEIKIFWQYWLYSLTINLPLLPPVKNKFKPLIADSKPSSVWLRYLILPAIT